MFPLVQCYNTHCEQVSLKGYAELLGSVRNFAFKCFRGLKEHSELFDYQGRLPSLSAISMCHNSQMNWVVLVTSEMTPVSHVDVVVTTEMTLCHKWMWLLQARWFLLVEFS